MMRIALCSLIGFVIWVASLTGIRSGPYPAFAQFHSGSDGTVSVDKTWYLVGETAQICYKPQPLSELTLTALPSDGSAQVLLTTDDGSAGCLSSTITLPTGTECVQADVKAAGGEGVEQTCFQVLDRGSDDTSSFQACGNIYVFAGEARFGSDAVQCFYQAFQQCQAAGLVVTLDGPYGRLQHTFSFQGEVGNCLISDAVQVQVSDGALGPFTTSACAGVSTTAEGLLFTSCGPSGDILVPAAPDPGIRAP